MALADQVSGLSDTGGLPMHRLSIDTGRGSLPGRPPKGDTYTTQGHRHLLCPCFLTMCSYYAPIFMLGATTFARETHGIWH
jgi:hypothetical protein